MSFTEDFQNFISEQKLFNTGDKILLATSGGVDSSILCHLFSQSGYKFGIAHCNFQLRGKDSKEDQHFVKELSTTYEVGFFTKNFDTDSFSTEKQISIQMAARELRYNWLEKIRKENNYQFIATAHHLNDSLETALLNITKGTGIAGLRGILTKKGKVIRPLLFASRSEIESYAKRNKVAYRVDESNKEIKYLRNKIRHQVIPILKEINPSIERTYWKTSHKLLDTEKIYFDAIEQYKKKLLIQNGGEIQISIRKLLSTISPKQILYEILLDFEFNQEQVPQIWECLDSQPGKVFFSSTHQLLKDRNHLIIAKREAINISTFLVEELRKKVNTGDFQLSIQVIKSANRVKVSSKPNIAFLDMDKLVFPLTLRYWKPGDYVYPLGTTKKKKIKRFLTDLKLSLFEKEKTMVLLSGEKVVWVVGYKIDNRFKITTSTKTVYKMSLKSSNL